MKKLALINWDTMQVEEKGVLADGASGTVFDLLNETLKAQGINKVWLVQPGKVEVLSHLYPQN